VTGAGVVGAGAASGTGGKDPVADGAAACAEARFGITKKKAVTPSISVLERASLPMPSSIAAPGLARAAWNRTILAKFSRIGAARGVARAAKTR